MTRRFGPQKSIIKRTRLQRQEDRNKELGLPPPTGVQLNQQPPQTLNDYLDQLQESVPSYSKRRRRGDLSDIAPSIEDCLEHIPDHQARKYLEKFGNSFED